MWGPYKNITEAEAFVKNKIAESDLQWVIVEKEEKKVIEDLSITVEKIFDDFFQVDFSCLMNKYNRKNR